MKRKSIAPMKHERRVAAMSFKIAFSLACFLFVTAADAQVALRSRITASAMDSMGNLYVTGWKVFGEIAGSEAAEILTIKYDKNGNMVWRHSYPNDPEIPDAEAWGIAVDSLGNVYVAGHVGTLKNEDGLLIKYPAGYVQGEAPEWVRTYAGGVSQNDQNWGISVDPDGYVYVTGYSTEAHGDAANRDVVTMKYDSSGTCLWAALYNGADNGNDVGIAVAVHPLTKNVYVTGLSNRTGGGIDMLTVMYDSAGTEQWAQRYGGPVNGVNRGTSLALDGEGNVYVTGWSQGTGAATNLDFATVKYHASGNQIWASRYDGPAAANDQPAPPVIWAAANVGATYSYIQNNQGIIVTEEVLDPIPAVEYLAEKVSALKVNQGNQVSLLAKLNACLQSLRANNAAQRQDASKTLDAFIYELHALASGGGISSEDETKLVSIATQSQKGILGTPNTVVYVGGQSTGAGGNVDFALVKYNGEDGSPMWDVPGQPGTTSDKPGNPANIALRYNGPANSTDRVWGMAMDQGGNIYLTGPSMADVSTGGDYFTIKYFVNTYRPAVLGTGRYDGVAHATDQSCGFATWRDPVTGREYIFRDPVTKEDYVGVTGNSSADSSGTPKYEYTTVVYDGKLNERWVRRIFE